MKKWNIIQSQIIHKTNWIEVVEDECEAETGRLVYTYTRRVDKGPLIIPEQDGKLWMVRQYRHPIRKIVWQFPAEGMHEGESWEEAAKRGLAEELGLKAEKWIYLQDLYPDPGGLDQVTKVYFASGLHRISEEHDLDEHELLERGLFSMDAIDTMIADGDVCDGWTLSGLFLYKRYLKKDIIAS